MRSLRTSAFRGVLLVLAMATAAPAQVGGPPTGPATIWRFLGIPQGIRKVQGATRNRRGNHPNLEPKPPMKARLMNGTRKSRTYSTGSIPTWK